MPEPRRRLLIEDWLPITELGIESRRERAAASALPPLSFLHVWWARRPLVASEAVVVGGLVPAWSHDLAENFPDISEVQTEVDYHRWFLNLIGIWGDPVAGRALIDAAKAKGIQLKGNGYGYRQAFRNAPSTQNINILHRLLIDTWGEIPLVSDPTAGGGSIPFVSARLGLPTHANDLNPIAAAVLKAGVEFPAVYGLNLTEHLQTWGRVLVDRIGARMKPYFPLNGGENVIAYIWANAVRCPRTDRWVPLMGDKWLRKGQGDEVAVRVVTHDGHQELDEPSFEVVRGADVDYADANRGFVARGSGISPYDDLAIDGVYIKAEAKAGRMKPILYAIAFRGANGKRDFRAPVQVDLDAVAAATGALEDLKTSWFADGYLPSEAIPEISNYERGHRMYGINTWLEMFSPRQALAHGSFAVEFERLIPEVVAALGEELGHAVLFELGMMQGKSLNWNARSSTWDVSRQKVRSVFEKHNFSFKWTFAEFDAGSALYPWCLNQLLDAYGGIAALMAGTQEVFADESAENPPGTVHVTQGSAAHIEGVATASIAHVCIDPPYYDNVMYAELADYFYVWEKRTLGRLQPSFFSDDLTDKENEAVANPARFSAMGARKRELATLDYQSKMTAIFAECHRIMRDDGVLSVMFTHKRADAWDTLGAGLLDAGFTIETSWPVNSESEQSLHQANMNSAASTIMLVCRKRSGAGTEKRVFLEDLVSDIRTAARDSVVTFREHGIDGVDLLLSTYGPVLSVISEHWPVYSMTADDQGASQLVRPEQALDIAREEVVRLQRARIVGDDAKIDAHTDFLLMAWETFKAPEFPFDDARRLALATGGLEVQELERAKILTATGGKVALLPPSERLRRGAGTESDSGVRIDATSFVYMNDAVDTVLYIGSVDGFGHAKIFMDRLKLTGDTRFRAALQGFINAIPRMKVKGEWLVPQAGLLDTLVTAYFPDIDAPPEPVAVAAWEQDDLLA